MGVGDLFKEHYGEFLKFDRIPPGERRNRRPDLCAMIYLDEKLGGDRDVVTGADHDVIYLCWDWEEAEKLTAEDVIYVLRCGVHHSTEFECMALFV
jgi:hypothetical protein